MRFDIRPRIRRAFHLALRRRDLTEREIDEELRTHVAFRVSQLVARGLTREEAERVAYQRFGGSWDETVHRLRRSGRTRDGQLRLREWLDAARADLAYAVRTLVREPGFATVVVLTFALGIGANATMFAVIDRLLLQPPPHVGQPGGVFELSRVAERDGKTQYQTSMQYALFAQLRADTAAFRDVAAASFISTQTLGSGAEAEQAFVVLASSNYFNVLATKPALGRFFGATEDNEVASSDVAVLGYGFWQRRFGGDPAILGKVIRVGPREFTVIGVAREGFTGVNPLRVDLWLPMSHAEVFGMVRRPWAGSWGSIWLTIYARLQRGVSRDAAAARVRTVFTRGMESSLGAGKARQIPSFLEAPFALRSILPSTQLAGDPQAKLARLLLGVTVVVLVITCANVASLLLARGTERRREIAVRLALGVSRWRLLRMLISETAVLAVCGGVAAIMVAHGGTALLQATLLQDFAWTESAFDGRVLAATLALVLATIVLAGLVPAFRSSRPDVVESLQAGGREGGASVSRLRAALMTAQATLCVVLIVGAGLFVQSLRQAARFRLGFDTTGVIAATMDLTTLGYKLPARLALYGSMRDRLAALPDVAAASVASTYALQRWRFGVGVRVPGRDSLPRGPAGITSYNAVSGDYFTTLGLTVIEGRPITAADVIAEARVAVLSAAMARAYWPNERAVDRCIMLNADSVCTTVVGVAADAKQGPQREDPQFVVYVPAGPRWAAGPNVLLVRARGGDARRLVAPIRRAMQSAAPNLPYADVQTLDDVLAPEIRPWKTGATLFSIFGGLALLIAAMGLYSAISYSVVQRRHEFGVRMALGARIADVVRLVMDQGVRAALLGIVAGSLIAIGAGRFVEALLFQTSPRSPAAFALAAFIIVSVAAAASFVPAWRAARVDPMMALRGE
jgi:predicted permease